VGPSRRTCISPIQNMKWFVWKWKNYTVIHPLFHNGKTRIKHWNFGPRISLGEISVCFVNSTVIRQRFFFTLFPTGNAKKVSCGIRFGASWIPTFRRLTRQTSNKVPQSVLAFLAAPDFNYLHTIDITEGQIARCFQKQF
jgi:hypothetical protein